MSKKIILASGSPRRKELLTLADVRFEIRIPDVDETHTGYSILEVIQGELKNSITRSVETKVFIKAMLPSEIKAYVQKNESLDKAGGYAAQGYGMTLIEKIDGSYTNVVGLPISQVITDLKKMGWKP